LETWREGCEEKLKLRRKDAFKSDAFPNFKFVFVVKNLPPPPGNNICLPIIFIGKNTMTNAPSVQKLRQMLYTLPNA